MQREEMKRVVRRHIELSWNKGHLHLIGHLHSPNFLYKSSFVGHALNGEGFIAMVEQIRDAMPDLEVIIEDCVAEGDQVATWSTLIGCIAKPALGYPPSDKVLAISAMAFWRFDRMGQIEEICTMFDMESFRAQLGLEVRSFAEKALP